MVAPAKKDISVAFNIVFVEQIWVELDSFTKRGFIFQGDTGMNYAEKSIIANILYCDFNLNPN